MGMQCIWGGRGDENILELDSGDDCKTVNTIKSSLNVFNQFS